MDCGDPLILLAPGGESTGRGPPSPQKLRTSHTFLMSASLIPAATAWLCDYDEANMVENAVQTVRSTLAVPPREGRKGPPLPKNCDCMGRKSPPRVSSKRYGTSSKGSAGIVENCAGQDGRYALQPRGSAALSRFWRSETAPPAPGRLALGVEAAEGSGAAMP
jgi:hypothetical protein